MFTHSWAHAACVILAADACVILAADACVILAADACVILAADACVILAADCVLTLKHAYAHNRNKNIHIYLFIYIYIHIYICLYIITQKPLPYTLKLDTHKCANNTQTRTHTACIIRTLRLRYRLPPRPRCYSHRPKHAARAHKYSLRAASAHNVPRGGSKRRTVWVQSSFWVYGRRGDRCCGVGWVVF